MTYECDECGRNYKESKKFKKHRQKHVRKTLHVNKRVKHDICFEELLEYAKTISLDENCTSDHEDCDTEMPSSA